MTVGPRRATRGAVFVAVLMLGACAARSVPDQPLTDGLPPWMEDGEEVRLGVAWKWLDLGFTQGAMSIVTQMRAEGSTTPELDLIQGKALLAEGVESEAERLLVSARDRMSRDPRPYTELCGLYADQKRIDEAITECQRAVKISANDAKAWNNLGFLLLANERLDEAREAAQTAITLDGGSALYRNNLGLVQAAMGQADLANRTLQTTMTKADAAFVVGETVERFHGADEARVWYERAVEANPDHRGALAKLNPSEPDGTDDVPVEKP